MTKEFFYEGKPDKQNTYYVKKIQVKTKKKLNWKGTSNNVNSVRSKDEKRSMYRWNHKCVLISTFKNITAIRMVNTKYH